MIAQIAEIINDELDHIKILKAIYDGNFEEITSVDEEEVKEEQDEELGSNE